MIDYQRLSKLILLALVVPVTVGGIADYLLGMSPYLLIASSLLCIPLSTVLVTRVTLAELDRVIENTEAEISQALEVSE